MKFLPLKMILIIFCVLFLFLGCQNSGELSKPILMRGFIKLDKSIESTYKPESKPVCNAKIEIVDTTSNDVVAQTFLKEINHFPFLYTIRQEYYKTYEEYWDNYSIFAYIYDTTNDSAPSLKGSAELDLYNYSYSQDITVK